MREGYSGAVKVLAIIFLLILIFFLSKRGVGKQIQLFDPSSVSSVSYSTGNCKHFPEGGVGCTEAVLVFSRFDIHQVPYPDEQIVVFRNKEDRWTMSLRYFPKKCSPLPQRAGELNQRFLCKGVSWRVPE